MLIGCEHKVFQKLLLSHHVNTGYCFYNNKVIQNRKAVSEIESLRFNNRHRVIKVICHLRRSPRLGPFSNYPTLSVFMILARQYLSIPGTSVPSERIFSCAELVVSKLRNRLSSSLVDQIIFLNKNYLPEQKTDD